MKLELQERYTDSLTFHCFTVPYPIDLIVHGKNEHFSFCCFYPIHLMVCQNVRLPSSIKKGNVLVIFEKWPNSKPISRDGGNF